MKDLIALYILQHRTENVSFLIVWKLFTHMTLFTRFLEEKATILNGDALIKTKVSNQLDLLIYRVPRGVNWLLLPIVRVLELLTEYNIW